VKGNSGGRAEGPVERRTRHPRGTGQQHGRSPPLVSSARPCSICLGVSFRFGPSFTPRDLAAVRPACVRSTMSVRSNSARAAIMWKTRRPPALVVSMASLRDTKPAPFASMSFKTSTRCDSDRPSRSSRHTTRTTPGPSLAKTLSRPGRFARVPLVWSSKMVKQPAAFKASCCRWSFWSWVETRA
jgi:hypothetical protein